MPVPTLNPEPLPGLPQWAGVRVVCSTRTGGVSAPPFDSLNLGDHVGDDPQAVVTNRHRLRQLWGMHPVFLKQVHGTRVLELDRHSPDGSEADACFTRQPGLACTIMVADCLPLVFHHPEAGVVAAAHAGWRGLAAGVIEQTLAVFQAMGELSAVRVWLGPCIGPTAFEVGEEVRAAFMAHDLASAQAFEALPVSSKYLANLPALARQRLAVCGVEHIEGNDGSPTWCTFSQSQRFFSHRRDGRSGRFAVGIGLV